MTPLDASRTRPLDGGPSFSLGNRIARFAWTVCWTLLARWTPAPFKPWRRFLLRLFGAEMGPGSDVRGSATVWFPPNLKMGNAATIGGGANCYNMAMIVLEEGALVSQGAHLCAGNHDIDDPHMQLIAKPITLRARSWVAADAFVAPGVTLGEGAVLGARAAAFRDLEPWQLYLGNPAQPKRPRRRPPEVG